jgi:hypothetical protein
MGMNIIPEDVVEETSGEMADFSQSRAKKEMTALGESQPELLTFMMEFTQDLDQDAQELAFYMFFVVCRIFEKASATKIKKISPQHILKCFESNEALMRSLEGTREKLLEKIAKNKILKQPYVTKYVVDTLFEAPQEEDPIHLTEEDVGFLFLLFKTVIDSLDQSC